MTREDYDKNSVHFDNPVLKTMIGKRLGYALEELGFLDISENAFTAKDIQAFHEHMPELPASQQFTAKKLIRSLHRGKIIDIQTDSDGTTRWTIAFKWLHYACTAQFSHQRENWKMVETPQIQYLPGALKWAPSYWSLGMKRAYIFDAIAVVLLVVVSFTMGSVWAREAEETRSAEANTHIVQAEEAIQFVQDQGYLVLTPEKRNDLITQAHNDAYKQARQELAAELATANEKKTAETNAQDQEKKKGDKGNDKNTDREKDKKKSNVKKKSRDKGESKKKDSDKKDSKKKDNDKKDKEEKEKTFVFTMKEGMPVGELVNALQERGFIKDKEAFLERMEKEDLVTKVDVGDYKFKSGMSEKELLEALK